MKVTPSEGDTRQLKCEPFGRVGGGESSGSGFPSCTRRCRAAERGEFHRLQVHRADASVRTLTTGSLASFVVAANIFCFRMEDIELQETKVKKPKSSLPLISRDHHKILSLPPPDAKDSGFLHQKYHFKALKT